jgi:probable HAF family extracellular repeat protein
MTVSPLRSMAAAASAPLLLASTIAFAAPPLYTATRIFEPSGHDVVAKAINNHGDVVGWWGPPIVPSEFPDPRNPRAFVFSGGVRTDLSALSGNAVGLNDAGQVVGTGGARGFAYVFENGSLRDVHPVGAHGSWATAINAPGAIVGEDFNAVDRRGFLLEGGRYTTLPSLFAGGWTAPRAINADGQIAGYSGDGTTGRSRAVLVSSGGIVDLGASGDSKATALNNRGDAVGYAYWPYAYWPRQALLFTGGQVVLLPSLGGESAAYGINDANQIVGESQTSSETRAFLHMNGETTDLNELVVSGLAGTILRSAVAINASGQIVANSCLSDWDSPCAAFRLDPLTPGKARAIEYYNAASITISSPSTPTRSARSTTGRSSAGGARARGSTSTRQPKPARARSAAFSVRRSRQRARTSTRPTPANARR